MAANVVDCDGDIGVSEVALGLAFWWRLDIIEGLRAVDRCFVEVEVGYDGTPRYVRRVMRDLQLLGRDGGLGLCCHCGSVGFEIGRKWSNHVG